MSSDTSAPEIKGRQQIGVVTSDKMDKTVVVTVERSWAHPLYKKVVRSRNKFTAHDADNVCNVGDRVRLAECRPMSARKRWRVVEVIHRAPGSSASE